jgi:ElaB/YqjD/DUF883 family membrane-anchored ribosome-binding protein
MNQYENRAANSGQWPEQSSVAADQSSVTSIQKTVSHKLTDAANALREKADSLSGKNREIAGYGNQAADWLEHSANYLEELNPQQLKSDLEKQVRNNPGRSLLIATAAGLVIGSLIRRRF